MRGRPVVLYGLVVAALALTVLGAVIDPRRAAFSYLTAYGAILGVVLGALSLVMIAHVTGARWLAPLLPLARATAATLPLLAILFLPIAAGLRALYPWAGPLGALAPVVREHVLAKTAYLNVPFFLARAVAYFVIWTGLAELLARASLPARGRWSAIGLPPFAFATTFAAIDWIMSLLPQWWSTIFGLYFWSGGFLAALATMALLARLAAAPAGEWGDAARSNTLGKLLLTFVLFWAYVGFSQFLVIWIGDVPIETSWLAPRVTGGWRVLAYVLLVGQFALPFLALLPRRNRERPGLLAVVACWLLIVHYLDVYWLVMPALGADVAPHWLDLTTLVALVGVTALFGSWRLRRIAPELASREAEVLAWW